VALLFGCSSEKTASRPLGAGDSASTGAPSAAPASATTSATLTREQLLADSAARLDALFQRERAALNREATVMDTMQRTTTVYAERYNAHRARVAAATRLRSMRDSVRALASARSTP
jgi:hypothetical protein